MAQAGDDNIAIEGRAGSGGTHHDTDIAFAKPAMALVGDGNTITKGGTGFHGVIRPVTAHADNDNIVAKAGTGNGRGATQTPSTPVPNQTRT